MRRSRNLSQLSRILGGAHANAPVRIVGFKRENSVDRHKARVPSQRVLEIESGASGVMTVSPQAARSMLLLVGG